MSQTRWQFWIDVGGTFTDCLAKTPSGEILRRKLLSSGVTKGSVGRGSTAAEIIDASRVTDPPGFWNGGTIRLLNAEGQMAAEGIVERNDDDEIISHVQSTNAPDYVNPADGEVRVRQDVFDPGLTLFANWSLKVDRYEVVVSE